MKTKAIITLTIIFLLSLPYLANANFGYRAPMQSIKIDITQSVTHGDAFVSIETIGHIGNITWLIDGKVINDYSENRSIRLSNNNFDNQVHTISCRGIDTFYNNNPINSNEVNFQMLKFDSKTSVFHPDLILGIFIGLALSTVLLLLWKRKDFLVPEGRGRSTKKRGLAAVVCISVIAAALILGYYLNQLGYEFTPLEGFS